ncbi:hypothetical protein ABZP36_027713 [Zizania latifolia]
MEAIDRGACGEGEGQLWIALAIGTNSSAWLLTAVLVTNMRNFRLRRGVVAGLLKGYVGLSAALFTQIFVGLLHRSPTGLLLLLAVGLPLICLAMMYYVRPCTPAAPRDASAEEDAMQDGHFAFAQVMSIILCVYLLHACHCNRAAASCASRRLAIPAKMTLFRVTRRWRIEAAVAADLIVQPLVPTEEEQLVIPSHDASMADEEGAVRRKRRPRRGEDFEFSEAVIGVAVGSIDTTVLLSLFGLGNFFGRLGGGAISEKFMRHHILVVAYLCLANALGPAVAYASTAVVGFCYGVQFSVMISTTSELFGLDNFGLFYNIMSLANPLGSVLFSGELVGRLYDEEATRQQRSGSEHACLGPDCFRVAFVVLASVCSLGMAASLVLAARIRPVYRALYSAGSSRLPNASEQH